MILRIFKSFSLLSSGWFVTSRFALLTPMEIKSIRGNTSRMHFSHRKEAATLLNRKTEFDVWSSCSSKIEIVSQWSDLSKTKKNCKISSRWMMISSDLSSNSNLSVFGKESWRKRSQRCSMAGYLQVKCYMSFVLPIRMQSTRVPSLTSRMPGAMCVRMSASAQSQLASRTMMKKSGNLTVKRRKS